MFISTLDPIQSTGSAFFFYDVFLKEIQAYYDMSLFENDGY